jgi:pimeloyl-ACP methyl ester carboxylesterase
MNSRLAEEHRLVAFDMRGHGVSDKPRDGYNDSKLWADDVHAIIQTLDLDHPVLSGWSYGPLVFLDYVRHYGDDRLGGLQFVGAVTKLGSDEAMSVLTPEFLSLIPELFSTDTETSVRGLATTAVFRRDALDQRVVPDAGLQCLRPALCPSGTVLAVLP